MIIGILVAMQSEYDSIKDHIHVISQSSINNRNFVYGTLEENNRKNYVVCSVSGIGKVNAAVTAMTMIKSYQIDAIISTGCCGGLNPDSQKIGDIHVGSCYGYHDVYCSTMSKYGQIPGKPEQYLADENLLDHVSKIFGKYQNKIHYGLMMTGDRFIDTPQEVINIKSHFPVAETCEMESTAIAQVCYEFKKPFLAFRVISDLPSLSADEKEHMKKFEDFWKTMGNISGEFTRDFLETFK